MAARLLTVSSWLYRLLLRLYPRDFRRRFAVEMAQVFRGVCDATYRQSGRGGVLRLWLPAFFDGVAAASYQWRLRLFKGRMEPMSLSLVDRRDGIGSLPVVQAGLAALPFLGFGISSMLGKLGIHTFLVDGSGWAAFLLNPYLVFYWLVLVGLGAGLLAGFPRWAYAYLGWAVVTAWWWSDMSFLRLSLGWKIWLPLAGVILIALLVRRSLAPVRTFLSGLGREWTLLVLGIYTLYAMFMLIADGNHHPYLLVLLALTALGVSAGIGGYFRAASPLRRILALVAGLLGMAVLGVISEVTWDYCAYYGLPEGAQYTSWVGFSLYIGFFLLSAGAGLLVHWLRLRSGKQG